MQKWFQKSHEEFKLQTSTGKSKKLKFDGLILPQKNLSKKYIPSAKTYTEGLTFNYLCENSPNYLWHYIIFHDTTPLYFFLAQTLHTFYKSRPPKFKFSNFPLLGLKFTKFLISFFKQKVSFSSMFGPLYSSCHFWNQESVFPQTSHHSSMSWDIPLLYFFI